MASIFIICTLVSLQAVVVEAFIPSATILIGFLSPYDNCRISRRYDKEQGPLPCTTISGSGPDDAVSLEGFLNDFYNEVEDSELHLALVAIAQACCEISKELVILPFRQSLSSTTSAGGRINPQGEKQKGMDVLSNDIMIQKLKPIVAALASEEEDTIVFGNGKQIQVAFDPLDGSSNLDVNIPTGTIFGISPYTPEIPFSSSGRALRAAGYALYSASTELILALKTNDRDSPIIVKGFALKEDGTFYLSRDDIVCPSWGPYYSLNEGREPDWPEGLRRWINDAKNGRLMHPTSSTQDANNNNDSPTPHFYSSRYVCSLCADVHRTLLKGGWAGNPRPHLRLLYEAAPMAFICEATGGKGSDGVQNLLDIVPQTLHDRVCVFLGSRLDIESLEKYGDAQQSSKRYNN